MTAHQPIDARPVVARAEGMFPENLDGYEAHRNRVRGDKGNIVRARSKLNRPDRAGDRMGVDSAVAAPMREVFWPARIDPSTACQRQTLEWSSDC